MRRRNLKNGNQKYFKVHLETPLLTTLIQKVCLKDVQFTELNCTANRNRAIMGNDGCPPGPKGSAAVVHDAVVVVSDTQ